MKVSCTVCRKKETMIQASLTNEYSTIGAFFLSCFDTPAWAVWRVDVLHVHSSVADCGSGCCVSPSSRQRSMLIFVPLCSDCGAVLSAAVDSGHKALCPLSEHMPVYDPRYPGESEVHFLTSDNKTDLDREVLTIGGEKGCADCKEVLCRALNPWRHGD